MRATGIVRRMDDLGRVVIPKEIRKTLRLRDGDALEIFTDAGGEVIFKKYSPIGELSVFAAQYADAIQKNAGVPVEAKVAAIFLQQVEELLEQRRSYSAGEGEQQLFPVQGSERKASVIYPIVAAGDAIGSVIMLGEGNKPGDAEIKLTSVAASFLGKQMEE